MFEEECGDDDVDKMDFKMIRLRSAMENYPVSRDPWMHSPPYVIKPRQIQPSYYRNRPTVRPLDLPGGVSNARDIHYHDLPCVVFLIRFTEVMLIYPLTLPISLLSIPSLILIYRTPCLDGADDGIELIEAGGIVLSCLQTRTGVKFVVTAEPGTPELEKLLREIYVLYSDCALKDPFYELEMPIRTDLFTSAVDALLERFESRSTKSSADRPIVRF
jgi:hypothetical protein